jgi:hypothetical protein
MLRHVSRVRDDERGVALITALLATMVMLVLGLALLSIVDTQASQSTSERSRDRAFNLSESVLSSQAFVLSRYWPSTPPSAISEPSVVPTAVGEQTCNAAIAGFGDIIGSTALAIDDVDRLRANLNASSTDKAYTGASWQVNMCDDTGTSTVWSDSLLTTQKNWDKNANNLMWVRVQSTVEGKTRSLAGLVRVRSVEPFSSKFGLVAGSVNDDLGTTVDTLASNVAGGVLASVLGTTPTVAADPTQAAASPPTSGVTGLRCGALDMKAIPLSTCVSGTLGALGSTDGLPIVNNLLTGGKLAQYPTLTTATAGSIAQLRAQAIATKTYYSSSVGSASTATGAGAPPACDFSTNTGVRSVDTVVFIEKVGTGDQYCRIDVGSGVRWKALVIGSGRVIIRGNGTTTAAPTFGAIPEVAQTNTFSGVVYALNLQRLPVADGGMAGLNDAASPGREIVRIDNGAHIKGAVNTDGKSGKVGVYPPTQALDMVALKHAVCDPLPLVNRLLCNTLGAVGDLLNTLGLGILNNLINGIVAQLGPQRVTYGSAITSDVAAIKRVTVYGTAGVVAGTFRDLQVK